jgi:hypothetical protein
VPHVNYEPPLTVEQTMKSMSPHRSKTLVLSIAALLPFFVLIGCQPLKKPASPERAAQVRESIHKNNPNAVVGIVIYTLTEDGNTTPDKNRPYTAVGDLPVPDVKMGQTVTFIDVASGKPVSSGVVVAIQSDSVHVRYDTSAKRPPATGDLAVIIKD